MKAHEIKATCRVVGSSAEFIDILVDLHTGRAFRDVHQKPQYWRLSIFDQIAVIDAHPVASLPKLGTRKVSSKVRVSP